MVRLILLLGIVVAVYLWWRPPRGITWPSLSRWLLPAAAVVLALLYLRSPVDLIPDFSGVGLLDDLLILLGTFWWARRRFQRPRAESTARPQEGPTESRGTQWDPYAVLGVHRGASQAEISHGYREQMKRYHPDRVNQLGEDLQRVAHQKTLEIQRAYDELRSAG